MPKPNSNDIPIWFLVACFILDPAVPSGLRWRNRRDVTPEWNKRYAGKPAGRSIGNGYFGVVLTIDGRKRHVGSHRVVWTLFHGRWPEHDIDHVRGVEAGNGIGNLREATNAENCQNRKKRNNNTSGFIGVWRDKRQNKWRAEINVAGKHFCAGMFDTREAAAFAYLIAKSELHPFQPIPRDVELSDLHPYDRMLTAQKVIKTGRRRGYTGLELAGWQAFLEAM
jgi:hypothetical protein